MNMYDFKMQLINSLKNRNIFTQQVSNIEIRTRCPYCGDSIKNLHTGHLYIRINPHDNYPCVFNCFKCPASGILKETDLELLGIDNIEFKNKINTLNKVSNSLPKYNESEEYIDQYFDYKIPDIKNYEKIKYIENRLGYRFNDDELNDIKIITSFKDFLILNEINTINCKPYFAKLIEDHYVGFLSKNNSHILFRDITDKEDIRWYKYPINNESKKQKVIYSISSTIDLYTKDDIIINLSEGVMDSLGIKYNLNKSKNINTIDIAICGKFYLNTIKYLIETGFIGDNIIINIYADNDHKYDTSLEYYKKYLNKYKFLVKEINIFYNVLEKDYGVQSEKIQLIKYKI